MTDESLQSTLPVYIDTLRKAVRSELFILHTPKTGSFKLNLDTLP